MLPIKSQLKPNQIADKKVKNIKAYVLNGDIHSKTDLKNTNAVEHIAKKIFKDFGN